MKRNDQDELADLAKVTAHKVKEKALTVAEDAAGELAEEIAQKALRGLIRWGDKTFGRGK